MVGTMVGLSRGIGSGALAVTASFLLASTVQSGTPVGYGEAAGALIFAPIVASFAVICIALASLLLGMPLVWLLARVECDSAEVVAVLGALCGLGLLVWPALAFGGSIETDLPFVFAAAIGGGVTGAVWGMIRDGHRSPTAAAPDHPNRLHDPRILR